MWRRRYEEDWERRKQYLIRSLFEDIPPLSPIPEADESFNSARCTINPLRPHISKTFRPDSPLPPLIIEKEPNRHDEPEAFYKKLEKKILKVYRKLFIEGKSDISSSYDDDVRDTRVSVPTEEVWKDIDKQSQPVVDDNDLHSDTDTNTEIVEISSADISVQDLDALRNLQYFDSNYLSSENSFGDDHNYAVSENEESDKSNENKQSGEESDNCDQSNSSIEEEVLHDSDETLEKLNQGRKRTISQGDNEISKSKKSRTDSFNSEKECIEEQNDTSINNHLEDEELKELNDFRDHRVVQVEADIHINAEEMPRAMLSVVADDFEGDDDDTVVLEEIRVPDNIRSSGGKRSWSSVSEESVSYEEAGTQTQCSNERDNDNILRDIFVGPPKVFRLCSCVNHICVC